MKRLIFKKKLNCNTLDNKRNKRHEIVTCQCNSVHLTKSYLLKYETVKILMLRRGMFNMTNFFYLIENFNMEIDEKVMINSTMSLVFVVLYTVDFKILSK
jgi:hypothetical protein